MLAEGCKKAASTFVAEYDDLFLIKEALKNVKSSNLINSIINNELKRLETQVYNSKTADFLEYMRNDSEVAKDGYFSFDIFKMKTTDEILEMLKNLRLQGLKKFSGYLNEYSISYPTYSDVEKTIEIEKLKQLLILHKPNIVSKLEGYNTQIIINQLDSLIKR